jgi:hypothetical protein
MVKSIDDELSEFYIENIKNKYAKIIQNKFYRKYFINNNNNNIIKNKGTGAGGKNTNKNGLDYEKITNLLNFVNINFIDKIIFGKNKYDYYDILSIKNTIFYRFNKKGLHKYFIKILF